MRGLETGFYASLCAGLVPACAAPVPCCRSQSRRAFGERCRYDRPVVSLDVPPGPERLVVLRSVDFIAALGRPRERL